MRNNSVKNKYTAAIVRPAKGGTFIIGMKKIFLFGIIFGFLTPISFAAAQVGDITNNVSETVQSISGAVDSVKNSFPIDATKAIPSLNDVSGLQSGVLGGGLDQSLNGMWNSFNSWTSQKIGISLGEILSTILNFVMWMLNLFVKIVQAIINVIPR
jgi:hypothetical protein